jgi:hypothetical protein
MYLRDMELPVFRVALSDHSDVYVSPTTGEAFFRADRVAWAIRFAFYGLHVWKWSSGPGPHLSYLVLCAMALILCITSVAGLWLWLGPQARRPRRVLLVAAGLLASLFASEARASDLKTPRYRVTLLTVAPGSDFEERLGHSALAIEDRVTGSELAYNFGTFAEREDVFLKFLHNELHFYVASFNPGQLAVRYRERQIRAQELGLTDEQAGRLAAILGERVRPQNRHFDYDLFTANCVTPIRDLLDIATDGALRRHTVGRSTRTFRQAVMQGLKEMPLIGAFTALIYGPYTDRSRSRWEMLFMPDALHDAVAELQKDGRPLVLRERQWRGDAYSEPLPLPDPRVIGAGLGLLLAIGLVCQRAPRSRAVGQKLLGGLGGLLALGFGALGFGVYYLGFTPHACVQDNANRFLLNPLDLVAALLLWLAVGGNLGRRGTRLLFLIIGGTSVIALVHVLFGHLFGLCAQEHWPVIGWALLGRAALITCAMATPQRGDFKFTPWGTGAIDTGARR